MALWLSPQRVTWRWHTLLDEIAVLIDSSHVGGSSYVVEWAGGEYHDVGSFACLDRADLIGHPAGPRRGAGGDHQLQAVVDVAEGEVEAAGVCARDDSLAQAHARQQADLLERNLGVSLGGREDLLLLRCQRAGLTQRPEAQNRVPAVGLQRRAQVHARVNQPPCQVGIEAASAVCRDELAV